MNKLIELLGLDTSIFRLLNEEEVTTFVSSSAKKQQKEKKESFNL